MVVAGTGTEARTTEIHVARDAAKPVTSRDLHGPIRAGLVEATGLVRPAPDGSIQRRRRSRRPGTSNRATTENGCEGGRPRNALRQAAEPTAKLLAKRLVALVPVAAEPEVRLLAVEIMATSLEGGQPRQVAVGRRPAAAAIEPKRSATTTGLIPLLQPATVELLEKPSHGAIRPETLQTEAKPTVQGSGRPSTASGIPR